MRLNSGETYFDAEIFSGGPPAAGDRFADEQGQNKVVRAEFCLSDQIAQGGGASQTPRSMNQFSHSIRGYPLLDGIASMSQGQSAVPSVSFGGCVMLRPL